MIPFLGTARNGPGILRHAKSAMRHGLPSRRPPLGPLKGPKPRPNQTHNLVSFADGLPPDGISFQQEKTMLPLAAVPCRIGQWS